MTTIRFHYRQPGRAGWEPGRLFIRIIHARRYKDIRRDYRIYPEEWDPVNNFVRIDPGRSERRYVLKDIADSMREDIRRLETITGRLSSSGSFMVSDIYREFLPTGRVDSLLSYSTLLQRELALNGRIRTARAYRSAAGSLIRFTGKDIPLCDIGPGLICGYERYLLDRGLKMNTVSFYMRNLRAIYYRAVKAGMITDLPQKPFAQVYTGVFETRRRALDKEEVGRLVTLERQLDRAMAGYGQYSGDAETVDTGDLNHACRLKESLLYFMFAYHSRGMSFIDLANLKKRI